MISLDSTPVFSNGEAGTPLVERLPSFDMSFDRIDLEAYLEELPDLIRQDLTRKRRPTEDGIQMILRVLRCYIEGETQDAVVARRVNLSRERVRQIQKTLAKLPSMKHLKLLLKEYVSQTDENSIL